MSDRRKATLLKALGETHPQLPDGVRDNLAEQLVVILDTSIEQGYDLRDATLQVKGAKRTSIGDLLKRLRVSARLRQEDVTARSRWHASKVSRIESGAVPISHTDVLFLLQLYGVHDGRTVQEAAALADQDRRRRAAARRRAA